MMTSKLEEDLRNLCCQYGWSYGIYWWLGGGGVDSGLLTVGGAYCGEQLGKVMSDVLHQVHMVGEGILGEAALSGRHLWISLDNHLEENFVPSTGNYGMLQGDDAWNLQFSVGIKTIAIIPLQPSGVLQFGSSRKILENLEFISKVKGMIQKSENLPELFTCSDAQEIDETLNPCGIPASVPSDLSLEYRNTNMDPLYDTFVDMVPVKQHQTASVTSSRSALLSQVNNFYPNAASMSRPKEHPVSNNTLLLKQGQPSAVGDHFFLSSGIRSDQDFVRSVCAPSFSSLGSNQSSSASNDEILTVMAQQLMTMLGTQELHGSFTQQFYGDSGIMPFHNRTGSHDALSNGGLLHAPHSLPPHSVSNSYHSSSKLLSQKPSFYPETKVESVSYLTFSEDLMTECATSNSSNLDAANNIVLLDDVLEEENDVTAAPGDENLHVGGLFSLGFGCSGDLASIPAGEPPDRPAEILEVKTSGAPPSLFPDHELFDGMELDLRNCNQAHNYWEDIILPPESANCTSLSKSVLECIPELDVDCKVAPEKNIFSDMGLEPLVEGVAESIANSSTSNIDSITIDHSSTNQYSSTTNAGSVPLYSNQVLAMSFPNVLRSTSLLSEYNLKNIMQASSCDARLKSQVSSWIDDCNSMNAVNSVTAQTKTPDIDVKVVRKRARPGESTRPRPKDRQLIQDRVKELREIIPNGSKCSIDSLLDRTIKHMLYLQNVTKYAEKLKQGDEAKMIGEGSGVVLRDNASGGGATWAFEVAGQTMVCPIIVEDVSPPGQMLVEMLCEERGFFLEIADMIRGFGLTILKGVMEVRDTKIWARFLVEANRNVTRMEIFLSLVQLLQQTASSPGSNPQPPKEMGSDIPRFDNYTQSHSIPITLPDILQ